MDVRVQHGNLTEVACDALIVNLFEGVTHPGGGTGAVDRALDGWLATLIAQDGFRGKLNSVLEFPTLGRLPAKRVIVVGLGQAEEVTLDRIRQACATAVQRAKTAKARTVATLVHGAGLAGLPSDACAQMVVEGAILGTYDFRRYKTPPSDEPAAEIDELLLVECAAEKLPALAAGATTGQIIADGVCLARDLATEPPDLVTPSYLAGLASELAAQFGLGCEVWDEHRIIGERMSCLWMVGRGSAHPPRFIRLDYRPATPARKHVCLIGKGLCYDSGGLSLKPAEFMRHMKTDMSGAAAVLAVFQILGRLKPEVAVTGLIPCCENMIGAASYKVDDVLRARNGKTIEIDNTDAEGRLVLADALSYAAEEDFDELIDIATLTGGCIIALARIWTGVMGTDQALIDRLLAVGLYTGERMWHLPFDDEVRGLLDSDVADMKNSGGREGSAIQGGMFLKEFAGEKPWAHLDIAGTSYLERGRPYQPKGATGVPVRALVEYLRQQ